MEINKDTGEIQLRAGCIGGPSNYCRDTASAETGTHCPEPTLAQQQFLEDSDINTIVKRFGLTGELPIQQRTPLEGEFFERIDYQQALNALRNAEEAFLDLPASVRTQFDNDPGKLIAFMEDPGNRGKAEELGIVMKPAAAEPPPAKDTPPAEA